MGIALGRLAQKIRRSASRTDEESGQTIISGMGELHLEIIVDRMKREFNVEANVGAPQVAYRECIKKAVEQEGKFVKQSGGRGQFGHVWIKIEPNETGWVTSSSTPSRAASCPANSFRRSTRALQGRCRMACWPASRWSTSRSRCSTVPTTTWIRTKTPSDGRPMAFKDAMKKASPTCSSR